LLCFSQMSTVATQNELAISQIKQMEEEIKALNGRGEAVQKQLSTEQQNLLIASHKLVANKTFGWSRLFADLEAVLPGSVSASRIAVENIYKDADGRVKAELDFGVISRDYPAVMTMIANMNGSGVFQADLKSQDRQQNERVTYTEYTLHLIYTPAYGYAPTAPNEVALSGQGGAQ
jgi:Tfp pilus assembly protein PilN